MLTYPEYKNSGIKWIGDIPIDWSIIPAKQVFTEIRDKNSDGSETNALQFKFGEIISKKNFDASTDEYVSDTIATYTIVEPNTIMINGLNLNYDLKSLRVAIVKERGVITSAYLALKPNESKIVPQFANYLLKGYETRMAFHNMGSGVRLTLGFKEFKNQPIVLPELNVQEAIVDYLDKKTKEIDALISEAASSVEEYNALKQAVIFEAVTQGIDGSRQTKESRVFWAQRIPDTWDVGKVARLFSVELGKMLDEKRISGARLRPYLRNADVQWSGINTSNLNEMDFSEEEDERYGVKSGDLLVCEGGDVGKSCIVPDSFPEGIYYQKALHRVRAYDNDVYSLKWLRYVLFVMSKFGFFNGISGEKATIQHLPAVTFNQLKFPMPKQKEKERIVLYLEERIPEYDALISEKQTLIQDLQAYKKSLIFEVVTGKRKVV